MFSGRRLGQPSRLKPVGGIVEATRTFFRSGDKRPAEAANLWSVAMSAMCAVPKSWPNGRYSWALAGLLRDRFQLSDAVAEVLHRLVRRSFDRGLALMDARLYVFG